MATKSLQHVLCSEQNIDEKLQAEGIFVGLVGTTMEAKGLFSIGIGERFVVVAGIRLRGLHIDYNLVSLRPVGLLGVTYRNPSRIITISSPFKDQQVFQLCSSSKAAVVTTRSNLNLLLVSVWDDFTTVTDNLVSESLSYTSSNASVDRENLNYRCLYPKSVSTADRSSRSISLPNLVSGPTIANQAVGREHLKRSHSLDCVDVSSDSFSDDNVTNRIIQQTDVNAHVGESGERRTDAPRKKPSLLRGSCACLHAVEASNEYF